MMTRGIPITKYGIEYRIRLAPLPTRSRVPPRFQPELEPSVNPTKIAMTSASPMRIMVGQKRTPITSVTDWPRNLNDSPKSPAAVAWRYDRS
jgi:hypothetical protein